MFRYVSATDTTGEKMVSAILDLLVTDNITLQKMRKLYEIMESKLAKDKFYKVLEDQKKFLLHEKYFS